MEQIRFDFNNMFSQNAGTAHGVTGKDIAEMKSRVAKAAGDIKAVLTSDKDRVDLGLEWARLPFQDKRAVNDIQKLGNKIASSYENVISLGIGGSYLGLKAAQDALCPPYYNEFGSLRRGRARIYFDGNNLDPDTLSVLLKNLDPKKTFVIVISKSGETTETKAAFAIVERWLRNALGNRHGRQIIAITDPGSGALRKRVSVEQAEDPMSFRSLPVMKGVGGRFSELNIGLLHLAIIGVNIRDVLDGAAAMYVRCISPDLFKNPASLYAALHTILYLKKSKYIAILMPFSETLKSTADWYIQLLAESLGKKYSRHGRVINIGRTPISSRGTNDLHSIQQNNIDGMNNKAITFIRVGRFARDIKIRGAGDLLEGRKYSELLSLAEEATEWALARQSRPSCTIIMPEITPFYWGGLIFFFEVATAFEGELLDVNAFDQPGVEGYKNYMYYKLGKPGISPEIASAIKKNPLKKVRRLIV